VVAVRVLAGRSQREVARRSGLGRTHIVQIEQGRQNITLTTLFALARGLDVAPAELLSP
jgi:transcriptional regulator with XRE-family HTH domain